MMKLLNILLVAAASVALAACTTDAGSDPQPDPQTGQGRKLSFGFPAPPVTYGTIEGFSNEKMIYQVAVFIEAGGGFYKFFSTEADGSALGFYEVLNDRVSSQPENIQAYTAGVTVDVPHDMGQITNVAVIGNYNYPEDSYTDRLKAVGSWAELAAFRAPVANAGLLTNTYTRQGLLSTKMFKPAEIASLVRDEHIEVELERNAARIYIEPKISVQIDGVQHGNLRPDWNRYLLNTVRLVVYNPKTGTYLLPQLASNADRTAIPQYDRWVIENLGERMPGRYYYCYEMTGDEADAMEIYILYKYRANTTTENWVEGFAGGRVVLNDGSDRCELLPNSTYVFPITMTVDVDYNIDANWSLWL